MIRALRLAVIMACAAGGALAQDGRSSGLEYRLETESGRSFEWADGKAQTLHQLPFMGRKDFARAVAVAAKNPNLPGSYDVEIAHSAIGTAKFAAVADADRARSYCVVFRGVVRACSGFAPAVKGIYNGSTIPGLSRTDAEALARAINASLK